jgi:D-psicose/D-tagatose/L-ribulose 3-epimerase
VVVLLRFGAHAFVWVGDWTADSGDHAIQRAAKIGFDFIEIPLLKPNVFDAKRHRETLREMGIGATCSLALPKDLHMPSNPNGAKAFLVEALEKVTELGSDYLGGCTAYALGTLTGHPPTPQEHDTVVACLREVALEAKQRGITLALEACNRYETYLYNTLAETRETILRVGADNLKLHADTYHMNIEEEGFYRPIIDTVDVLDYLHMSESHRGLVGTGTVIWDDVWRALAQVNFQGALVLESFAAINPDLAAATCLWRPPRHQSEVLAREGLVFLKEGAAKHGLV